MGLFDSNADDGTGDAGTVYSATDDWSTGSTPAGNQEFPAIDWTRVLVSGVPRIIDNIFGNSVQLNNARPVVLPGSNPVRGGSQPAAGGTNVMTLLIVGGLVWMLAKG